MKGKGSKKKDDQWAVHPYHYVSSQGFRKEQQKQQQAFGLGKRGGKNKVKSKKSNSFKGGAPTHSNGHRLDTIWVEQRRIDTVLRTWVDREQAQGYGGRRC